VPLANEDPLVGQTIDGRFEVRARLGQGGMGTVYRAWQRSVAREVAIKLMDVGFSRDPTAVRRFEREAQLASKLAQPNTVSVFDFGQAADGRLFIAMELIRGRTLYKVLTAEGTFSVSRAARIGVQICDALEAAHKLGIVHRDLKLENVMVLDDPPGRDLVKVLDFGLAKQLADFDPKGTGAGIVVGTPRYMAPEIAVGGKMSPAADLYALGVLLAEIVTGRPLWDRDTLAELLVHKMKPHEALDGIPPGMRALVAALLDPKPELRPNAPDTRAHLASLEPASAPRARAATDAGDTLNAAATIVERQRATADDRGPPTRTRRWGTVGLVLVALTAATLVAIGVFGARSASAPADARATVATPADADPWRTGSSRAFAPGEDLDHVTLHVESHPHGALVTVDGVAHGTAPVEVELARADVEVPVTASWGAVTVRTTVRLDRSHDVHLSKSLVEAPPAGHADPGCWDRMRDSSRHCRDEYCAGHGDEPQCL
jgi:serine/threonine-protein kinase